MIAPGLFGLRSSIFLWVLVFAVCGFASSVPRSALATSALPGLFALPGASLMVEEAGRVVIAHQPDRPMVPASTLKLLTAMAAIERWGLDHRFHTVFYLDNEGWLWVKGGGDPFLVSEELDLVTNELVTRGVTRLQGIATDSDLFATDVEIDGRSTSNNPYDAPVAALAVNFNTINVKVNGQGVVSAEAQTPMTPLALSLAAGLGPGRHRVNLRDTSLAPRYFAEVLSAKLMERGVTVGSGWRPGQVPTDLEPLYVHYNSRDLRQVLAAMLDFSNNFIANQLFILLGEADSSPPLTIRQGREAMNEWVHSTFAWKDFHIEEGAGLSRNNRLTARQLLDVVKAFTPYRELLPEEVPGVQAKTGTLRGVSCLAGYLWRDDAWVPFSLMINQSVPYDTRIRVARDLMNSGDLAGLCKRREC